MKECIVNEKIYIAIKSTDLSCKNCVARHDKDLCLSLDACTESPIIWQEKTEQLLDENKQYPILDQQPGHNMLNKCTFIGNLGKDSEIKFLPSGDAASSFSIACTEHYKDKNGEKKELTDWINCTMFGKHAEALHQYLNKGQRVYIEGKFKTRKWKSTDGKDNYSTFIKVDDLKLLGSGKNATNEPTSTNNNTPPEPPDIDDFDDDIPF